MAGGIRPKRRGLGLLSAAFVGAIADVRAARPDRLAGPAAAWAAGASIRPGTGPADVHPELWDTFREATFLAKHPGWTWQALQDTPADIVEAVATLDHAQAIESRRKR